MIVRTTKAREFSFELGETEMVERTPLTPWFLRRIELKDALTDGLNVVRAGVRYSDRNADDLESGEGGLFMILEGRTPRGRKTIWIGCKCFAGVNRTRLIRWAKGAK